MPECRTCFYSALKVSECRVCSVWGQLAHFPSDALASDMPCAQQARQGTVVHTVFTPADAPVSCLAHTLQLKPSSSCCSSALLASRDLTRSEAFKGALKYYLLRGLLRRLKILPAPRPSCLAELEPHVKTAPVSEGEQE